MKLNFSLRDFVVYFENMLCNKQLNNNMSPIHKWNSMIHGMIISIVRLHLTIATIHPSCNLLYSNQNNYSNGNKENTYMS